MCPTEDKQNRLSTLSQDVIAVGKKATATGAVPAVPAESARKPIPPSQDVFNVPLPPPPTAPATARPPAPPSVAAPAAAHVAGVTWAALALAAVAIAIGGYALSLSLARGTPAPDPQIARLAADLQQANARVLKLEQQLSASAEDSKKMMESGGQSGFLQVNANLRGLRNDLDRLSNEQLKLADQVAAAIKAAKAADAQAAQAIARTGTLAESMASARAAAPANADTQTQLKALGQKTDKLATDIRQLYRLVDK